MSSMKVVIIGPNLFKQDKGQFHVHAAGCGDIARDPKRYGYVEAAPHMPCDVATKAAAAEYVYCDIIAERGGDETGLDYLDEFHFAPCVADLK